MKKLLLGTIAIIGLALVSLPAYAQTAFWDSTDASATLTEMRLALDIGASDIPSYISMTLDVATGVVVNNSGNLDTDTAFTYVSGSGNPTATGTYFAGAGYDCTGAVDCDFGSADILDMTFITDGGTVTIDGSITIPASSNLIVGANTLTSGDKLDAAQLSGTTAEFQTANSDGTFKVAGLETLFVPASAMTPATTSGAAAGQTETSTNKINFDTLDFDTAADEFAHFMVDFPKSWNLGTITFNGVWTAATGGTTGIALFMECVAIGDNVTSDTAYGTAVGVTDDAQTGALEIYVTATSAAITIGNTPADDEMTFCRVSRDVSDANDDLAEDMLLLGINVFYTTDAEDDT